MRCSRLPILTSVILLTALSAACSVTPPHEREGAGQQVCVEEESSTGSRMRRLQCREAGSGSASAEGDTKDSTASG